MAFRKEYSSASTTGHIGSFLTGFLAGAIMGSALGVLLAPHRGDITRRKIVRTAEGAKDQVVEAVEDRLQGLHTQEEDRDDEQKADS